MGTYKAGQLFFSPLHRSPNPKSYRTYGDVNFDNATFNHDGSSAQQFQPLDFHVEIGEEISSSNVVTRKGIRAVRFLINRVKSLHVHDNLSINTVIPGSTVTRESWAGLKSCCIERCPRLNTVFTTDDAFCFPERETLWAADLLMARCVWSKGWTWNPPLQYGKLRAMHLHLCPRLTSVLPLSGSQTLSSMETIRITYCGDLSHVLSMDSEFEKELSTGHGRGELEFPKLRRIYLHDLPKLHQICEAKMLAPMLETIWVRGCWSLKRLPATAADRLHGRTAVDCEKEWWEKLEWDGMQARHHPSLFEPRHSRYYKKKNLLRGTVLR